MAQISGEGSTGSIVCIQGQAKGSSRQHALTPISEGIPEDILLSFGVQESQGEEQALHLAPHWEIFFPMFPGELKHFLPSTLMEMDLQLRERNLSDCLVESWVSGFTINLRIELTDVEGEALIEAMGLMKWSVPMVGIRVVTGLPLDPMVSLTVFEDFLGCKMILECFLLPNKLPS